MPSVYVLGVLALATLAAPLRAATDANAAPSSASAGPCPPGAQVVVVTHGSADAFKLPVEDAPASPSLTLFIHDFLRYPQRAFDESGANKTFAVSMSNLPVPVCGATLEIKLRADTGGSFNDSINFGFLETFEVGESEPWVYSNKIAAFNGGSWQPGNEATFHFDLANLPPDVHGTTNVLSSFAEGNFAILTEDDTMVDYFVLRLCTECGDAPAEWGIVKQTLSRE